MILFSDSFDHYTTLAQKWDVINAPMAIAAGAARNGANGLKYGPGASGTVGKNIANKATLFLGFAFQVNVAPGSSVGGQICSFLDAGTYQVDLRMDTAGHLTFTRGNGGATLGTSASALSFGVWHYVEVKVTIDPTVGVAEVKVDGVFFLQLSAQNTRASANSFAGQIRLGNDNTFSATTVLFYDDVYLLDNTGAQNNTYLGDVTVAEMVPSANGTQNSFSIGGTAPAATNWQSVSEVPPDDDVTLVLDSNVGDIERYKYPALNQAGTPVAVVVWNRAKKDDAGTRSIRAAVKSGATVSDSGTDQPLSQSYQYLMGLFETDPNTGAAWTVANINAAEFGAKLTA